MNIKYRSFQGAKAIYARTMAQCHMTFCIAEKKKAVADLVIATTEQSEKQSYYIKKKRRKKSKNPVQEVSDDESRCHKV